MRKKVSAMLEIVVCDDDIADLERAVNMLHKIFTSQKIAYHIEQFASANQMLENISNIDIGILDISMEELNGIKLGRKLKEKFPDVKLVYITSYEEYQDKEMYEWYKQLLWIRKKHACISEGELIGAITKDEEETIVLIRKNVEETIALIFNCSSNAKNFSEYEGKYNLLRDEPFNGKVEGLDAAVIML